MLPPALCHFVICPFARRGRPNNDQALTKSLGPTLNHCPISPRLTRSSPLQHEKEINREGDLHIMWSWNRSWPRVVVRICLRSGYLPRDAIAEGRSDIFLSPFFPIQTTLPGHLASLQTTKKNSRALRRTRLALRTKWALRLSKYAPKLTLALNLALKARIWRKAWIRLTKAWNRPLSRLVSEEDMGSVVGLYSVDEDLDSEEGLDLDGGGY
jgi:hypothetical protein